MDNTPLNELRRRVNNAVRDCAVAETSLDARQVMQNLFESVTDSDVDLMRCLLVELSVCMFHGFSKYSVDEEDNGKGGIEISRSPIDDVHSAERNLPPSRLGTVPPPTASQIDENYQYDEYSDDSSDDSNAYSTYFEAESTTEKDGNLAPSVKKRTIQNAESARHSTEEKWAEALSEDIHRRHYHQTSPEHSNNVTCDDLFQALLSNASSVVLPKVPTAPSSTASVVSSDSSIPSRLPCSHTQGSSTDSSLCSTPSKELCADDFNPPPEYSDTEDNEYDDDEDYEQIKSQTEDSLDSGSSVSTIDVVARPEPDHLRNISEKATESPYWDAVRRSRTGSGEDLLYGPRRLRNILEACIAQELAKAEVEHSSTPKKKHTSNGMHSTREPLVFTVAILKKICRAVAIELSLELRETPFSPGQVLASSTSSSGALNTSLNSSGITNSSPIARDIGAMIWPVISAFVGASESEDMITIIVDMLETHILEKRLFPTPQDNAVDSIGTPISKGFTNDMSTQSVDGSLHVPDPFQNGIADDEPDEYANSEPDPDCYSGARILRSVSISDQSVPGDAQRDLVERYVDAIAEGKKTVDMRGSKSPLFHGSKQGYGSPRRFQEESGSYSASKASQIRQKELHAWDMPKSPLDDIFRQTMGAMGSPLKMPPMISHDIDDSTSQGSSEEEERDVLEDYYDYYEDGEDSKAADTNSQNYSLSTNAAVAGSLLSDGEAENSESDEEDYDDNDERADYGANDGSDEYDDDAGDEYEEDENGIRVDDLPDDFGVELLTGSRPGRKYSEPDAFDLDSLEEQLSKSSPNGRFPSNQPSIDEILVAECLDNLIVLPKGDTPVSSPDVKKLYLQEPHRGSSQRTTPDDIKGSPKFRERDPCTSSDEENGDITDDDQDTSSYMQQSLRTDAAVAEDILLSGEGSDESGDEKTLSACASNTSFDRANRHIPPSPYPTDPHGFQGQIPYPQDVIRCDSVEECEEGEGELYTSLKSHVSPCRNTSQYDESDENSSNCSSSSSSGMYVDPMESVDEVEQQMIAHEIELDHSLGSPSNAVNLSLRSMTSDDEREDDRRLFDAIMASAPPVEVQDSGSDVAYMSELMRASLLPSSSAMHSHGHNVDGNDLIHMISSNAIENVSHRLEDILYGRETISDRPQEDDEDVIAKSRQQLEKFEKRAAAYLASHAESSDIITGQVVDRKVHSDIRFDDLGLAICGDDDVNPTVFGDDNIPDFIRHALDSGAKTLPVTGNDELDDQFTKSFRELMQYYSSQDTTSSTSGAISKELGQNKPRKNQKSSTKKSPSKSEFASSTSPAYNEKEVSTVKTSRRHTSGTSDRSSHYTQADRPVKSPAVTMRATPIKESPMRLKMVNLSDNGVDTSKHIIAGPRVSHGGKEIYGGASDEFVMAKGWNETGTRIGSVPTAPPSIMRVRYTSNSATAAATVEKERRLRAAEAAASKSGRVVKIVKRPKSAGHRQLHASASEVDLRAASLRSHSAKTAPPMSATMIASKKSRKRISRSENEKRLQRLSAPTFSSVARVLDTAGMNVGELQSIALASREAAEMITAAASAGDNTFAANESPKVSKKKKRSNVA